MSLSCGVFDPDEGTEELIWQVLTVVDLSGDPKVLRALHTLRTSLEHVDFRTQSPTVAKRALQRHLGFLPARPTLIVLVLGEHSSDVSMEVREILRALDSLGELWIVAVVSENPSQWSELPRVHGFIKAAEGHLGVDAAQFTLKLATLFAPETLICVDVNDLCEALGTAHSPSTLSRAFWQEGNERRSLIFPSPVERRAVETAAAIAVMPLYPCTRLRETRDLLEGVREIVRDDCACILSAPLTFIQGHAALGGPHKSFLFLCRPDSA